MGPPLSHPQNDETFVEPHLVGTAARQSNNYHMGIMLLERMLRDFLEDEESRARHKQRITKAWHFLAILYRSLGEEDVLAGIYRKIAITEATPLAIKAEMEGDYWTAFKVYTQAVDALDAGQMNPVPISYETDIWEAGRLECMARLGKWPDLAKNASKPVEEDVALLLTSEVHLVLLS